MPPSFHSNSHKQPSQQSKHQLLPIPAPELNLNPNMTQNPGW
ncbi:MAG: RagB/SusD family nutrient uptake outer membrane protein [Dysgonamonadaceae bacterium]|nr:RagB/SusD family nutrient uptake outer membrane protein [Dysgonamonadaceae bacterium]